MGDDEDGIEDVGSDTPIIQYRDHYDLVNWRIILDKSFTNKNKLRGLGRVLAQRNFPSNYTCNKFPRVYQLKGSVRPDCCKKKCVNVKKD
ncbi:hypothetical protein LguiB_027282 [Lonicera macranthoides]